MDKPLNWLIRSMLEEQILIRLVCKKYDSFWCLGAISWYSFRVRQDIYRLFSIIEIILGNDQKVWTGQRQVLKNHFIGLTNLIFGFLFSFSKWGQKVCVGQDKKWSVFFGMLGKWKVLSNHVVFIKLNQVILFPYIIGRFQKKFWFPNSRIAEGDVKNSNSTSVSDRTLFHFG